MYNNHEDGEIASKQNSINMIGEHMSRRIHPSHSNVIMHVLHTVLYTFPKMLTRRFCLMIKVSFVGDHFLHSHDLNV